MRLFFLLACLLATPVVQAAEPPKQPNVVIFLADDLGYGDLGYYGHPRIQTPHLDAFAKQGVRMTQCYSASAVCSPSRSAILTGRTPHRNGVYTWIAAGSEVHLRTSEVTLPRLLKDADIVATLKMQSARPIRDDAEVQLDRQIQVPRHRAGHVVVKQKLIGRLVDLVATPA